MDYSSLINALIMLSACNSSSPTQHDEIQRIGDLTFTQLAELRHRGAFSTVAQTFASCCVAAAKNNSQRGSGALGTPTRRPLSADLLDSWYRVGYEVYIRKSLLTVTECLSYYREKCVSDYQEIGRAASNYHRHFERASRRAVFQ